jgi:hypothetical protein
MMGVAYIVGFHLVDQTVKKPLNKEVRAEFVTFLVQTQVESSAKSRRIVKKHYVVYKIQGVGNVLFKADPNRAYPNNVTLYGN